MRRVAWETWRHTSHRLIGRQSSDRTTNQMLVTNRGRSRRNRGSGDRLAAKKRSMLWDWECGPSRSGREAGDVCGGNSAHGSLVERARAGQGSPDSFPCGWQPQRTCRFRARCRDNERADAAYVAAATMQA